MSTTEPAEGSLSDVPGSKALRGTLSRLSNSRSRPDDSPSLGSSGEPVGGLGRTLRFVSDTSRATLSRTGLSSLFPTSPSSEDRPPVFRKNSDSPAPSFVSRNTMAPDTSAILYPTLTSHPPPAAHPILVLSLPETVGKDGEKTVDNDTLFDVILGRLEPWVGEEGEGGYVLVVLAGGEAAGGKMPGVGWWAWKWRRIPRKYRKNLKRLYIVHPSLFTRTLLPVLLPFLSPKSYAKLHPLPSLLSLYHTHGVSLHGIDLPLSVMEEEAHVLRTQRNLLPSISSHATRYAPPPPPATAGWSFGGALGAVKGAVGGAVGYLPLPTFGSSPAAGTARTGRGYWNRSPATLVEDAGGKVPRLLVDLRKAILGGCINEEGIFRRSPHGTLVPFLIALLDLPPSEAPTIPWDELATEDPLLPPKMLLRVLVEMEEPIFPAAAYPLLRKTQTINDIRTSLVPSLDPSTALILDYVIHTLHHVSLHEPHTKMSPLALAIVLAPSLIRGVDPRGDAAMCLEPGKTLPSALAPPSSSSAEGGNTLVGVLKMWIEQYTAIQAGADGRDAVDAVGDKMRCTCPWTEGKEHPTPSLPSSAKMGALSPASAKIAGRHQLLGGGADRQRRGSGSERSWTMVDTPQSSS